MSTNTETQSTAILTVIKAGERKSTQRYASVELAENSRAALEVYLPGHTFGLIIDTTSKDEASARDAMFEVESQNGKVQHNIPSYAVARHVAVKYATADNTVTIRQLTAE